MSKTVDELFNEKLDAIKRVRLAPGISHDEANEFHDDSTPAAILVVAEKLFDIHVSIETWGSRICDRLLLNG
jgi:hypothetical protein